MYMNGSLLHVLECYTFRTCVFFSQNKHTKLNYKRSAGEKMFENRGTDVLLFKIVLLRLVYDNVIL